MSTQTSGPAEKLSEFITSYKRDELARFVQQRSQDDRSLVVNWMDLYQYERGLAEDLLSHPKRIRSAADNALAEAIRDLPSGYTPGEYGPEYLRFTNLHEGEVKSTADTRSRHIGQYHEIYGQVSKVSQITPKVSMAAFECVRCGNMMYIDQPAGGDELQEPHECPGCERQGPWTHKIDESDWIDRQLVRIQQPAEETLGGQGAHLDVVLDDDAVVALTEGKFKPGNRVRVTGRYTVETDGKSPKPYLDGDVVQVENTDYDEIDISPDDVDRIREVATGDGVDPFKLIVDSIAPTHHGNRHIKKALALQMFRGVRAQRSDGSWTRGDSHILLLGDPGVGKSSLLRRMADVAPRSTYASGKGASAAGMTAAAVPSDFGDEKWDVQAGVLVLATGGIACVDEIDKVQEDAVSSMHDALEAPQVVEVDKADIHTTLPAQTSLLAAGNPKRGRFNDFDDIMEQADISPTLLSRFDLLFIMTDQPDEDRDRALAQSMIDGRQQANRGERGGDEDVEEPPLSAEFLRKYVAYARQGVTPVIEDDSVGDHLIDWFLRLRSAGYGRDNPVPITPRKLEAFQRLAEASARVSLSETVEKQDIDRVSRLIKKSLEQLGVNEDGQFDADVIETGTSKPQRDRIRSILDIVKELEREHQEGAPIDEVYDRAAGAGIDEGKAEHEILKLKQRGEIYDASEDHLRTTE